MAVAQEIRDFLPENYTYLLDTATYQYHSNDSYVATIRIKEITNGEMAKEWIGLLRQCSYVTWRPMRTNPKCGKINVFKMDLRCHHQTRYRGSANKKLSKNTDCPASLKITVRRTDIKYSRAAKPDPLIKEWPCIVILSNTHNHPLQSAEVLRFRDMAAETRDKILAMFKNGHTPSSVYHSLEVDVCLEHPDDCHWQQTDGAYLPSLAKIEHFYKAEYKQEHKGKSSEDLAADLEAYMEEWARNTGGKYVFGSTKDFRHYVVLCTPLMQRTRELVPQSREVVYLETVGETDWQRHRVYFFVTPTVAGGLPLGVIVSNAKTEEIFNSALNDLLALCCPVPTFFGGEGPKVLVTDYRKELKSLQRHFPQTAVLYNQYHVLECVWAWLLDKARNKVDDGDRQTMYAEFSNLVDCPTEYDLLNAYQVLSNDNLCVKYPNFRLFMSSLWDSRPLWASCYRTGLYTGASSACTAFRVLRESLMSKVMAFKLNPLVDFLVTRFESFVERSLLTFCLEQSPKCLIKKFLPPTDDVDPAGLVVQSHEEGLFSVTCDLGGVATCSVNARSMTCSCLNMKSPKMCKHLAVSLQYVETASAAFCGPEAAVDREVLLKVANFEVVTMSSQEFEAILADQEPKSPPPPPTDALPQTTPEVKDAPTIRELPSVSAPVVAPEPPAAKTRKVQKGRSRPCPIRPKPGPTFVVPQTLVLTANVLGLGSSVVGYSPPETADNGDKRPEGEKQSGIKRKIGLEGFVTDDCGKKQNKVQPESRDAATEDRLAFLEDPVAGGQAPESSAGFSYAGVVEFTEVVIGNEPETMLVEPQDCETTSDDAEFEALLARMRNGWANNRELFGPAVKEMMATTRKFLRTDDDLAKAMAAFGKFQDLAQTVEKENA